MGTPEHLYRFRSAKALLGDFQELNNQEIFFSSLEQLNDPMEGYKDVFWSGDVIVWRNLVRHYVYCLLNTFYALQIEGADFKPEILGNLVLSTPLDLPDARIVDIFNSISTAVLSEASVNNLIEFLISSGPIRRAELGGYLGLMHPIAMELIFAHFADRLPKNFDLDQVSEHVTHAREGIAKLKPLTPLERKAADQLFEANEVLNTQVELITVFGRERTPIAEAWSFFMTRFAARYASALDLLMHQPWYVACFVADPTDAAMWGTYADGHRGVCLKFNVTRDETGAGNLKLHQITGMGGGRDDTRYFYGLVPKRFYKDNYVDAYPEIDFFRSIGRTSVRNLRGFWYKGDDGEPSSCCADVFDDEEGWYNQYINRFIESSLRKTQDWAHEKEYRLTLHSRMFDFSEPEKRKLRYEFSDLAGIVFGVKTSYEDKLAIMKVIFEKCKSRGRKNFEFYQARYHQESRSFHLAELALIGDVIKTL
jgi:Protein of unknown function (DUF2971)